MFLDNPVLARAKGAEVVKQKLGILQRLMMKYTRMLAEHGIVDY
jgi:hypothetical protein